MRAFPFIRIVVLSRCLLFSPPRYNASRCSPNTLALSPARSSAHLLPRSARFQTPHSTIPLRTRIPAGAAARSVVSAPSTTLVITTIAVNAMLVRVTATVQTYRLIKLAQILPTTLTHSPDLRPPPPLGRQSWIKFGHRHLQMPRPNMIRHAQASAWPPIIG